LSGQSQQVEGQTFSQGKSSQILFCKAFNKKLYSNLVDACGNFIKVISQNYLDVY